MTKPKKRAARKALVSPPTLTLKWKRTGPSKRMMCTWTEYVAEHGEMTFYIIFDPMAYRPGWTAIESTAWVDATEEPIVHIELKRQRSVRELEKDVQSYKRSLLSDVTRNVERQVRILRDLRDSIPA